MTVTSLEALRKAAVEAKGAEVGPLTVKLDDIERNPVFQVRAKLDERNVSRLASCYKAGTEVAPIIVAFCGEALYPVIIDGHHRHKASMEAGKDTVEVKAAVLSKPEAMRRAAEANLKHGLQLKSAELREVFRTFIRSGGHVTRAGYTKDGQKAGAQFMSYAELGARLGKSKGTVRNWMQADFPATFRKMGGVEEPWTNEGQTPAAPKRYDVEVEAARDALANLKRAFGDAPDYWAREDMLRLMRSMLTTLEEQHRAEDATSTHWEPEEPEGESPF
ncbi:ParB domain protein nuclease [Ancylobacter novellus DSM 506]|uniref:ParB domain protein nuclease n=1 Tax=Ancylobacter novellus (strain ATCC 8093 / DSM 506 / JCM 20403 / CCM 1077 / IAM 12100 / NBRC 12443 / NCIMB 10456) TaxID=639283 RepID=D7A4P3_ANCN5|nr:ParB/RepB/Spo0J family partition protein [Ancylobacter novellus]ADH87941.1 ParB domain protein nuclease [Ancylobacter novellus DSM 506]